jgi:hypothetical protein
MAGYKELVADWKFTEDESGQQASRGFVQDPTGTDSLPNIGDSLDVSHEFCVCRRLEYVKFAPDRSTSPIGWKYKVIASYNTTNGQSGPESRRDERSRRFDGGGEILSIDEPVNWVWATDSLACNQPLHIQICQGSFTRPIIFTSDAEKQEWFNNVFVNHVGTINSAEWEGFAEGRVFFDTISGGTEYDNDGDLIWVFDLNFCYKIIQGNSNLEGWQKIIKDDWLYIWRYKYSGGGTGIWDKPKTSDGKFLYPKTDFTSIFAGHGG